MPFIKTMELGEFDAQAECLDFMLNALTDVLPSAKFSELRNAVYDREDTASTYVGDAVAVPHGRVCALSEQYIVAAISRTGVDWPSSDKRANLIFLIGVDKEAVPKYLSILQKIVKWRKALKCDVRTLKADALQADLTSILK